MGLVGQHVGGLEHRIEEQSGRYQLALGRGLLLELRHAGQIAIRGHRREQPAQLGVLGQVALAEEDASVGIEAGGEQGGRGVVDRLAQGRRLIGHRDRVQINHAVDRLATVLAGHVLGDGADVVAEVLSARGLDSREDPHRWRSVAGRLGGRGGGGVLCLGVRGAAAAVFCALAFGPVVPVASGFGNGRLGRGGFGVRRRAVQRPLRHSAGPDIRAQ